MSLKHPVMTKTIYPMHKIGDYTYGHPNVQGSGMLEIGKFCSFGEEVTILLDTEHHTEWTTTYPFPALFADAQHVIGHPATKGPVNIGHDVWIGNGVTILSGVTIGNGAVLGAGSVVSKNVAPYSIVAGNPAVHKRYRFTEEWIDYLNRKLKWWDWPLETILANIDTLLRAPGDHLIALKKKLSTGGK
jgi:virginiamycin A acetyltransferase